MVPDLPDDVGDLVASYLDPCTDPVFGPLRKAAIIDRIITSFVVQLGGTDNAWLVVTAMMFVETDIRHRVRAEAEADVYARRLLHYLDDTRESVVSTMTLSWWPEPTWSHHIKSGFSSPVAARRQRPRPHPRVPASILTSARNAHETTTGDAFGFGWAYTLARCLQTIDLPTSRTVDMLTVFPRSILCRLHRVCQQTPVAIVCTPHRMPRFCIDQRTQMTSVSASRTRGGQGN